MKRIHSVLYKEAESRCVVPGVAIGRAAASSLKEPAGIRAKVTSDYCRDVESLRRCRLAVRKHRIRQVGLCKEPWLWQVSSV